MIAKRLTVFMGPLLYRCTPRQSARHNLVILSRAAKPGVKDLNQARFSAYLLLSGAPGISSARPTLPSGKATDFNR
jgi:hypothetical protein